MEGPVCRKYHAAQTMLGSMAGEREKRDPRHSPEAYIQHISRKKGMMDPMHPDMGDQGRSGPCCGIGCVYLLDRNIDRECWFHVGRSQPEGAREISIVIVLEEE